MNEYKMLTSKLISIVNNIVLEFHHKVCFAMNDLPFQNLIYTLHKKVLFILFYLFPDIEH